MLKPARERGPSSQGCNGEKKSNGSSEKQRDTYIILVVILVVGQFHNTIGTLKINKLHSKFSSFTSSPCCSRLVKHGLTQIKNPFKAPGHV